jgi:hypothetical protein
MNSEWVAVLTGDVIDSSKLPPELRERLHQGLQIGIDDAGPGSKGEIFRGDSFQIVLDEPAGAMRAALRMRSHLRATTPNALGKPVDTRVAVGIGKVSFRAEKVIESDGEAFQLSGRGLDELLTTRKRRLLIRTPDAGLNASLDVICAFLDEMINGYSARQAEAVGLLLDGMKQTEIAQRIGIGQSSVNQRIQSAHWPAIEYALEYFERVIQERFPNR